VQNIGDLAVSIIIAAYGAADTIGRCLDSVYASAFRDFEVIVVDDGSTDDTARIARSYPCQVLRTSENSGPGPARNLGAMHAAGRLLYFLDADMLINPDTLSHIVESLDSRPEYSAMMGSFEKNTEPENFASVYKNLLHYYTHQNSNEESVTFCGGMGVIRRDAFFAVGGFNPQHRFMEDVELGYRLHHAGHRIWLDKNFQTTHLKRYSFAQLIRSDLAGRAIPWTRIMLETRIFRNDLNTRAHNVASVPLAFLMLLLLACPLPWARLDLPLAVLFLALNRGFLQFTWSERGGGFAVRAALLCWFGYLYSGAGAAVGIVLHMREALRREPEAARAAIGADDTR
jgi:glycosyltransferase involved in cell wall biosynthesis